MPPHQGRVPPRVEHHERVDKHSARPAWNAERLQTHGPNSVRKLPDRAQVTGAVLEPHKQVGLQRFDDQRPNTYISEHKYMNEKMGIQSTLLVEPHTSWQDRQERHRSASPTAVSQETGAPESDFPAQPRVTLLEEDLPSVPQLEYGNSGFTPYNMHTVKRSTHRSLAGLRDHPTVKEIGRVDLYQPTIHVHDLPPSELQQYHLQLRQDWYWKDSEGQRKHKLARREWFQNERRKDYVWNANFGNGVFRKLGLLTDSEVRLSTNPNVHAATWKHRVPFVETKQNVPARRNPAQKQFDAFAATLVADRRGFGRLRGIRERSCPP